MTDAFRSPAPTLAASGRYRLRTLGTLMLAGPDGDTVLGSHRAQRRRLSLLAILAVAGAQGRSRDQLGALFWPEANQARARHSLEQLLYEIRTSIGPAFVGINPLRLSPDIVTSDVGDFKDAVERGELEAAVDAYQGSFLEGFHLGDAPEFERWLETERARLDRSYAGALERLARDADAAADHTAAERWWRKLNDADPVSGKNAAGLIRALMSAGDYAAALQYARRYETIVAQELGTVVDPAVSSLVTELRASAAAATHVLTSAETRVRLSRTAHGTQQTREPEAIQPAGASRRRFAPYLGVMLALVFAVGAWVGIVRHRQTPSIASGALVRPAGHEQLRHGATQSIAAYELFVRGDDPVLLRSDSGARTGLEYFRQATILDPNYAAAFAGMARMELRVSIADDAKRPRREQLVLAEQAALRSIALDDSLADGHAALGLVRTNIYDLHSAEAEMSRAVALDPTNGRLLEYLAQLDVWMERPVEALSVARRALALDQMSPSANAEVARALMANDRCDEALSQLAKLRALRPPLLRARIIAAQCRARNGMWAEAVAEMQATPAAGPVGPRERSLLAYFLARAGRATEVRPILAALIDRYRRTHAGAYEVATVYAGLGDTDQAFAWLSQAVDDRSLVFEFLHPVIDGLPRDARLARLRRRIGLGER